MSYFTTDLPNLASEIFDGEVVVADFVVGSYFSLTGTAADVWQALRAGNGTPDIARALATHYQLPEPEMVAAVDDFATQLVAAGLAAPLTNAPAGTGMPVLAGSFTPPVIERHDDLQDLLLLDPVHDVAQAGWPHLPETKE